MKKLTLENPYMIAEIKLKGAELCRLYDKQKNREIIWNGDPTFWGRHAPVLFPFVGKLKNGSYRHLGKTFQMGQHGFARDMDFKIKTSSKDQCILELTHSKQSEKVYPFKFKLTTTFTLSEQTLITEYKVSNPDDQSIYFSLGAHPAFNCPASGNDLTDYQLVFEKTELAKTRLLDQSGLLSNESSTFFDQENIIPLQECLFEKDALMFTDLKSQHLTISSFKDKLALKIAWHNFPFLGIWKPLKAPFLCIEPWYGIADLNDASGNIKDKFGIIELEKEKVFQASYSIEACTNE